jgi:hypothetical protein
MRRTCYEDPSLPPRSTLRNYAARNAIAWGMCPIFRRTQRPRGTALTASPARGVNVAFPSRQRDLRLQHSQRVDAPVHTRRAHRHRHGAAGRQVRGYAPTRRFRASGRLGRGHIDHVAQELIPAAGNSGYPPLVVSYYRFVPFVATQAGTPELPLRADTRLLDAATKIGRLADFIVITSNFLHLFQTEIEEAAGCEVLSMIDLTLAEIERRQWRRVGIPGFGDPIVYTQPLAAIGLASETIAGELRTRLDDAILKVMEAVMMQTRFVRLARRSTNYEHDTSTGSSSPAPRFPCYSETSQTRPTSSTPCNYSPVPRCTTHSHDSPAYVALIRPRRARRHRHRTTGRQVRVDTPTRRSRASGWSGGGRDQAARAAGVSLP